MPSFTSLYTMSSVMILKVDGRSNTELPMKKARSGVGPPCPNFSCSCFSVDWQHNSCLPTCFIPNIDDVCSALLLAAAQPVSVRPSLGLAVCCHVGFIDGVCVGEGGREFRGRPPNHYNELPSSECDTRNSRSSPPSESWLNPSS